LAAGLLKC